jgi:hypothetical protein
LGNKVTLDLNIKLPGLAEGSGGLEASVVNPEGMFKTNKDGCPHSGKKPQI